MSDSVEPKESKQLNQNHHEICEDETTYIVQEICENTNVEITSLSHADEDLNNNNDYDNAISAIKADLEDINSSGPRRESGSVFSDKSSSMCLICNSKIYPMEKLAVDGKVYHKNCFRCAKCRTILSVTNFNLSNNSIYCKTHFMELFKIRGKYDDDGNIGPDIVKQDEEVTEPIPTTDTKGLLEKFRQLETASNQIPTPSCRKSNPAVRVVQPIDDVVRSQDVQQDELPPPETAKAMVAKFRAMESEKNVPTPETVQQMQTKAKAVSTANNNIRLSLGSPVPVQDNVDYPAEVMPEEGTTKNLLSKFQNLSNNS